MRTTRLRRALALAITVVSVPLAHSTAMPPDGTNLPIYCDSGHVSGSSTWSPNGISTVQSSNHYVIDVEADCPVFAGPYYAARDLLVVDGDYVLPPGSGDAGHYSLRLEGNSVDTCAYGQSNDGVVTGTGPQGPVTGWFTFYRENAHLWISGTLMMHNAPHRFTLWLDIVPADLPAPVVQIQPGVPLLAQAVALFGDVADSFVDACANAPITSSGIAGHGVINVPRSPFDPVWDAADRPIETLGPLQNGIVLPAPAGVAFEGTATISCFGCGVSSGSASLAVAGRTRRELVGGTSTASFTVTEGPTTCPVTGSANGTITGEVDAAFSWTRVGAVAVITTSGDVKGTGTAAFVVESPVGSPCGGPVSARVSGLIGGA